jgi:hypothetical protein
LSIFWPTSAKASATTSSTVVCDTHQVNGGDQAFLMNLNTPLKFGETVYNGNVYVSPKGTITFGQGDYTFWDYPATPSISIASWDYHAFATGTHPWAAQNDLYVRYGSTATSICVDWKVLPWGHASGNPVYIRMIAQVDPVNFTWTPTYQVSSSAPAGARYGVRYVQNGPIFPLNIQTISAPPAANPDPAPTITKTEVGSGFAKVFIQASPDVTATAWRYQVSTAQQSCANPYSGQTLSTTSLSESILLSGLTNGCQYAVSVAHWNGSISLYASTNVTPFLASINPPTNVQVVLDGNTATLTWDAPSGSTVPIEKYSVFWSYDNFATGLSISSATTSATIRDLNYGVPVSINVRADNDTTTTYSDFSQTVEVTTPEAPESNNIPSTEDTIRTDDVDREIDQGSPTTDVPTTPPSLEPTPAPPVAPIPERPVTPDPTPLPEEPVIEPKPEPTPVSPTEESTPEPTPSKEPAKEPEKNEPKPLPEPEPSSPTEKLGELAQIDPSDLTDEQALELFALALEIFETAEVGSEEYQQALDALMIVAQSDDPELPAELAAIPLLGDIAGAILNLFNSLGNVGSDMSPEVRETAEKIVVVSIVVAQIVGISAISAMSSTSIRRP